MISIEEIFQAYYDARKNKRNTTSQLRFELDLEENLVQLYRELSSRSYVVGSSICFTINDSVKREVFAADFRDRVVHHFLYNRLSPFFESKFIYDSYSCRIGKGTLFGVHRLEHHIRSCSRNYTRDCYILKLDLKGYFMNIRRSKLMSCIERELPLDFPDRNFIMWLTSEIVRNEPIVNCRIKGDLSDWNGLPAEKSLFFASEDCGMPIGNLTSQLFSNIYLNRFDHWMKRELHCHHYGRYVDDFYVVHQSKEHLLTLLPRIDECLRRRFSLFLHPEKTYLQHYTKGVRFLGVRVLPYRIVPLQRLYSRTKSAFALAESNVFFPINMRAVLNSYLGILKHLSSSRFINHLLSKSVTPYIHGYFSKRSDAVRYVLY